MSRVAFLGALLAYVATASGDGYWLDGAEFTSATIALDIAHPPGHPLTMIWGKAFTLFPLGPLAFRVALGQAVAAAIGIACLCRALGRLGAAFGLPASIAQPLALAGSWAVAFCFGLWFQAVRPEVYALQGMLLMLALERLSALAESDHRDRSALYGACLAVGLGLANHHLMSFFFFPPLLLATTRALRDLPSFWPRVRALAVCTLLGASTLTVYAYLPLRAARKPPANLGDPTTLERIWWVVSARVYRREMGDENPQPMAERFADVLVVLVEQLSGPVVVLALVGTYVALRIRETRGHAVFWLVVAASVLLVRPWLGPVRGNPDSVGYLLAGLCAVAALAACAPMALFASWQAARAGELAARALALGCALSVAIAQLATHGSSARLDWFVAGDAFDEPRVRALPARSVVIATTPQTVFRQLEALVVQRARPDVALVPLPFLRYPGVADATVTRAPETRPLIERYLETDRVEGAQLARLARSRPTFLELDSSHVAPEDYDVLEPTAFYARVTGRRLADAEWLQVAREREQAYAKLAAALGPTIAEAETTRHLLWLRYMDAVHAAARGQREVAMASLRAGAALHPLDAHLQWMIAELMRHGASGPIDVAPFLRVDRPLPSQR